MNGILYGNKYGDITYDMYYNNGITQCSGLNVSYLGIYIPLKPKCSTLFAIWNLYNNLIYYKKKMNPDEWNIIW
jgi:hypothetical protein